MTVLDRQSFVQNMVYISHLSERLKEREEIGDVMGSQLKVNEKGDVGLAKRFSKSTETWMSYHYLQSEIKVMSRCLSADCGSKFPLNPVE